jgi:PTH1 family peptidyl-tRNA hydrolase
LGTSNYARLRYGIGNDFLRGQQIDYVLGTWDEAEQTALPDLLKQGGEIIYSFVCQGIARTMNIFNTKK